MAREKDLVQPTRAGSYIRNEDGTLTQTSPEVCAPEPPDLELLKRQLQEQLTSPLQNLLPRFRSQHLYNAVDPILHEAGTRLAKSREFVSDIESSQSHVPAGGTASLKVATPKV